MANISERIKKAVDGGELTGEEIATLFDMPLFTPESAQIQVAARKLSHDACGGNAEVHAQIGLAMSNYLLAVTLQEMSQKPSQ